jgi:hypothetical protein
VVNPFPARPPEPKSFFSRATPIGVRSVQRIVPVDVGAGMASAKSTVVHQPRLDHELRDKARPFRRPASARIIVE